MDTTAMTAAVKQMELELAVATLAATTGLIENLRTQRHADDDAAYAASQIIDHLYELHHSTLIRIDALEA